MSRIVFWAFLLLLGSGVLGATVFQGQIAGAAGQRATRRARTSSTPLSVREQNVDSNGFIRTHEQGTANVNVTNSGLSVATKPATAFHFNELLAQTGQDDNDQSFSINASMATITSAEGIGSVQFRSGGSTLFDGQFQTGHDFILPFPQPVPIDQAILFCDDGPCRVNVSIIGN
jgi:hypothetical protein